MSTTSFGKYEILRRIAVGGMAGIYLAVQRGPHGFEKVVVLKVILPELCGNDEFIQMFLDEARLAATLEHTNVVRVYDFGELEGRYYLAMEHLPGEDLASLLQQHKRAGQLVPLQAALDIVVGAATGLDYVHRLTDARGKPLNIVHRDVSPSNIIVTYHGQVKLVDFGIARAETNVTRTAAGTLKGKVAYVSPEQAAGDPLDGRSDVFALGTVLYELLTGQRLFKRGSDLATLKAVVSDPIPPPSTLRADLPRELDEVVMRALARPLAERTPTAGAFGEDLSRLMAAQGWVRSERWLADFMAATFEPHRRENKLTINRVGDAEGTGVVKTPSLKSHVLDDLSPLRTSDELRGPATLLPVAEVPTVDSDPRAFGAAQTVTEERAPRRRWAPVVIGAGVAGLVLGGLAFAFLSPPPPPPVVVVPTPTPTPVQDPSPPPPVPAPTPVAVAQPPPGPRPSEPVDAGAAVAPKVARGKLTLDTAPWCSVYLRGRKLGDTPLVEVPLPVGFHELRLVNEAKGISQVIEIEVVAGKVTTKKLRLE